MSNFEIRIKIYEVLLKWLLGSLISNRMLMMTSWRVTWKGLNKNINKDFHIRRLDFLLLNSYEKHTFWFHSATSGSGHPEGVQSLASSTYQAPTATNKKTTYHNSADNPLVDHYSWAVLVDTLLWILQNLTTNLFIISSLYLTALVNLEMFICRGNIYTSQYLSNFHEWFIHVDSPIAIL